MPSKPVAPPGRHRAGTGRIIGAASVLGLLLLVLGAMFSPSLIGWPPPSPDPARPRAAAAGSPAATPQAGDGGSIAARLNGAPGAGAPAPVAADDTPTMEADVFALTNTERAKQGCPLLRLDPDLVEAARVHSADMAQGGFFGHPGSDGKDPGERMRDAGYDPTGGWAENIARGQPTAAAVMSAWLSSPEHRGNVLNCGLHAIGVGAARAANGQVYWTQDFGTH